SSASIVAGIEYVTALKRQGHNIVAINASLGGTEFPFNQVESNAVAAAGDAGILFLAAAGNSAINVDLHQDFPSKYSLNLPNVITVSALNPLHHLADFSTYGPNSVQVAAPGVDILSTAPTYSNLINEQMVPCIDYGIISGTSQATPVATGIIALAASLNP